MTIILKTTPLSTADVLALVTREAKAALSPTRMGKTRLAGYGYGVR